jgi:hypothetical protein
MRFEAHTADAGETFLSQSNSVNIGTPSNIFMEIASVYRGWSIPAVKRAATAEEDVGR